MLEQISGIPCIVSERSLLRIHLLTPFIAPVENAIRYKVEVPAAGAWDNELFVGEPSFEGDFAWNDLMQCTSPNLVKRMW